MGSFVGVLCISGVLACADETDEVEPEPSAEWSPQPLPLCPVPDLGPSCRRYASPNACADGGGCPSRVLAPRVVDELKILRESIDFAIPDVALGFFPNAHDRVYLAISGRLSEFLATPQALVETRSVETTSEVRRTLTDVASPDGRVLLLPGPEVEGCDERRTWYAVNAEPGPRFGEQLFAFESGDEGTYGRSGVFAAIQENACDGGPGAGLELWRMNSSQTGMELLDREDFEEDPDTTLGSTYAGNEHAAALFEEADAYRLRVWSASEAPRVSSMGLALEGRPEILAISRDGAFALVVDERADRFELVDLESETIADVRRVGDDLDAQSFNFRAYETETQVGLESGTFVEIDGSRFVALALQQSNAVAIYRVGSDLRLALEAMIPVGVNARSQAGGRDDGVSRPESLVVDPRSGLGLVFSQELSLSFIDVAAAACEEFRSTTPQPLGDEGLTTPACGPVEPSQFRAQGSIGGISIDETVRGTCRRSYAVSELSEPFQRDQPHTFERVEITGGFALTSGGFARGRLRLYPPSEPDGGTEDWNLVEAPQLLSNPRVRWLWQTNEGRIFDEDALESTVEVLELSGARDPNGMIPGLEGRVHVRLRARWSELEELEIELRVPCQQNVITEE